VLRPAALESESIVTKSFLTGVLLAALVAAPAASSPADASSPSQPADVQTADVQVRIPSVPSSMPHEALRRADIFRILQGGSSVTDAALAEHLWEVAGSLARTGWTPPRVTVQVIVKDTEIRD